MASLSLPELQDLAAEGGYSGTMALSSFSAVLLLSACRAFMHSPAFWTGAGHTLTVAELDTIDELVSQAEDELMILVSGTVKQPDYALYRMVAAGVDGGSFDAGDWENVVLNTVAINTGGLILDGSGSFTGIGGDFWFTGFATGFRVNRHQNQLVEVVSGDPIGSQFPSSAFSGDSGSSAQTHAPLSGFATLVIDDDYIFQQRCALTKAGNGKGKSGDWLDWAAAGVLLYRAD